ncbi:MAG: phenylalanine--tRNA ligase subunit beta [Planctomycetes bacterium]|nr:phenylalanine--tRNA ligase subunit beta [Planctomycetota bacterium]
MNVSYNWLKDYCEFDLPVDQLVEMLTIAGSEVEGYEKIADDYCIQLEIKSNRADLLGAIGIAREVAAIVRKPLRMPSVDFQTDPRGVSQWAAVEVQASDLCPRYTARVISGVKVGPSPQWLADRLEVVGLRPINNIVDITNYVLMETGQPLHAFDYDTLAEHKIIVRRAAPGEVITTIDGEERRLTQDNLVIADARRPAAVAGVMGGADTEVGQATTNVLLESAVFDPISVRRTARALGLQTDSSYRFERGVDPVGAEWASRRAVAMIAEICGGKVAEGLIDANTISLEPKKLSLRISQLRRILGIDIPAHDAAEILRLLEFDVLSASDVLIEAAVPTFRAGDVSREIDLVEEVGRIYGFDRVPLESAMTVEVGTVSKFERCERLLRDVLAGCGFNEAISSSFMTPAMAQTVRLWPGEIVELANPLRAEESAMRPCLMASLLHVKAINRTRYVDRCEMFELGKVFLGPMLEKATVGIIEEDGFHELKGVVELMLDRFNLTERCAIEPAGLKFFKEGRGVKITSDGQTIGFYGEMAAGVEKKFDLQRPVWMAELDFDAIVELAVLERKSKDVPRYPPVDRDLAIVIDDATTWQNIVDCIESVPEPLRESVTFLNTYRGKQIEQGKKSVAFALRYRSADRTLTNEEVNESQARLMKRLEKNLGAALRA